MVYSVFRLKIQQIQQISCLFELSWGNGKQLSATLPYSQQLFNLYNQWQKAYLNFYKTALRARVAESGKIKTSPEDWHRKLVEGEAKLLTEFHQWLQQQELYELRKEIAFHAHQLTELNEKSRSNNLDIFLTCNSPELERLPWETWEITADFSSKTNIRLTRTPFNLKAENNFNHDQIQRNRVRILAILGDDTGLNFSEDKKALSSLTKIAEIKFVGWQPQQTPDTTKTQIQEALIDNQGWDILFFAGHSNETSLTGGQIGIAPNVSISVKEITPQLKIALENGLQFALFNSCSGLCIANNLIGLGLNQVAIMREPIHNQVAQVFLVWFLRSLAEYQDVHSALITACEYLKQKQNLTYPSAYLIPSLFSHPSAPLFRIPQSNWKQTIKQWLPTRKEAITVSIIGMISLMSPVTNWLLETRMLSQSIYRDITGQIPQKTTPPVLLVQIDEESIRKARITDPHPINRVYLANIVDKLASLDTKIIAIDYLLDRPSPEEDAILAKSVHNAITEKEIWFIFAAILDAENQEITVSPETGIAQPNWSLQGYTNAIPKYVKLPIESECTQTCPFAYLSSMVWAIHQPPFVADLLEPQLNNQANLRQELFNLVNSSNQQNNYTLFLKNLNLSPLTIISQIFGQNWLRAIVDFSLPPDVVYDYLPVWKLLENSEELNSYDFAQQLIIIAPGGYNEAGITLGKDNFAMPLAVAYWRERLGLNNISSGKFTGSEAHGYMIHHLLTERLVIPIPNLWAIALTTLLAKGIILQLDKFYQRKKLLKLGLTGVTGIYGLVGLQLYITAEVLIPWLLPSLTFLIYIWFFSRNKDYE